MSKKLVGESDAYVLKNCLSHKSSYAINFDHEFDDKFKLVSKYKFMDRHYIDDETREILPTRVREEYIRIKNLRTGEIIKINDELIDSFNLLNFEIW